ncbi:acyl-CoA thioesterase [Parahaliea mediterranea]|uniref:acyl-CoA thioesterase n=1 Tax=Parahaliea mediterranea TaxID=651086 RepID=UPI001F4EC299|nr:thioesterase family protein [Parahaliea mediterranea]
MAEAGAALAVPGAFSDTLAVRYSDTDAQGHLYFANYMIYADEVAGHFMTSLGLSAMNPQQAPCFFFTVNIQCDFIGECVAGDRVKVSVGYRRLGRSSAELGFHLANAATGEALAAGSITQVFVDKQTRRSCPMPAEYRQAILQAQPELAAGEGA